MPRQFAPHKSGVHRLACLSLYRVLLRECGRLSTNLGIDTVHGIKDSLRPLVRYRFENDRNLLSPSQVANGIAAGYGFLDLLRSCSAGSGPSLARLTRTFESMTIQADETAAKRAKFASLWKPPPAHRLKHLEHLKTIRDPANYAHDPSNPRVFQHPAPLSSIKSGVRKVPNLIVTQGIPVLKYPGPQPVLLNRVIKNKVKWGIKKFNQHHALEDLALLAACEDEWDDILQQQHGLSKAGELGWAQTVREVDSQLEHKLAATMKKNTELGKRLWDVVLAERELKEKERREARHERRMARKRAAEGMEDVSLSETKAS